MMKVKVITEFIDKNTGELHQLDEVLDVNEKRYSEIKKYVKEVLENGAKKTKIG